MLTWVRRDCKLKNQNPKDDITNSAAGPDYLNPDVKTSEPATAYRTHTYSQSYKITVFIDISIRIISQDNYFFGSLQGAPTNPKTAFVYCPFEFCIKFPEYAVP